MCPVLSLMLIDKEHWWESHCGFDSHSFKFWTSICFLSLPSKLLYVNTIEIIESLMLWICRNELCLFLWVRCTLQGFSSGVTVEIWNGLFEFLILSAILDIVLKVLNSAFTHIHSICLPQIFSDYVCLELMFYILVSVFRTLLTIAPTSLLFCILPFFIM